LLGVVLLLAGVAMWWRPSDNHSDNEPLATTNEMGTVFSAGLLGGGLGFLAGLVSIGGGIFLSPVLFLWRWAAARRIAAVTSLFIFVNSLAGLAGQWSRGWEVDLGLLLPLGLAVLAGGQIGTRLTLRRLSATDIRRVAAVLIVLVGVRLLVQVATA